MRSRRDVVQVDEGFSSVSGWRAMAGILRSCRHGMQVNAVVVSVARM